MTPSARSYLYAPGDRPDRFERALSSGADAVIFDLEDGVTANAKSLARQQVAAELDAVAGSEQVQRWVRVNPGDMLTSDLTALEGARGMTGIILPKATLDSLRFTLATGVCTVAALVETAAGVRELEEIATLPGVSHLAFGESDLASDLGMDPSPDGHELDPLRLRLVVASAAAGIAAPTAPVDTNFRDLEDLAASTERFRRLGYGSRSCIHPDQIAVVHAQLSPSVEAVERAQALVASFDANGGGIALDEQGRMVDEAVIRAARNIVDRAR